MSDNPRRVSGVQITLDFPPNNYTETDKRLIHHISKTCPVALSLHPDLEQKVEINFQ